MNGLDIFILVFVAAVGFIGWRTGIIRVAVAVAGAVLGVWLSGRLYSPVADFLGAWISSDSTAKALAFVLIFIAVFVAASVVAALLRKLLSLVFLGWVDRVAGLAIALVLGLGVLGAVLTVMSRLEAFGARRMVDESLLGKPLVENYRIVAGLLPDAISYAKDKAS